MSRSRYRIFDTHYPHFLTCTVVDWTPLFAGPYAAQVLLDSWKFLQESGRLEMYAYVIMENHVHWVAASDDLSAQVGDFKSFTARRIIDWLQEERAHRVLERLACQKRAHKLDRDYQLWLEGSHPQMLSDAAMMRQKIEYCHENPVKRGYVDDPLHWRYSSARNYAGQPGLLDVTTAW